MMPRGKKIGSSLGLSRVDGGMESIFCNSARLSSIVRVGALLPNNAINPDVQKRRFALLLQAG